MSEQPKLENSNHYDYQNQLLEAEADLEAGYGHSYDQIKKWVRSWGKDDELPSPQADITPNQLK